MRLDDFGQQDELPLSFYAFNKETNGRPLIQRRRTDVVVPDDQYNAIVWRIRRSMTDIPVKLDNGGQYLINRNALPIKAGQVGIEVKRSMLVGYLQPQMEDLEERAYLFAVKLAERIKAEGSVRMFSEKRVKDLVGGGFRFKIPGDIRNELGFAFGGFEEGAQKQFYIDRVKWMNSKVLKYLAELLNEDFIEDMQKWKVWIAERGTEKFEEISSEKMRLDASVNPYTFRLDGEIGFRVNFFDQYFGYGFLPKDILVQDATQKAS